MSLGNKIGILGALFLLSSCAVATFPDFSDEEQGNVLVAGDGLGSDSGKEAAAPADDKLKSKITIAEEAKVKEDKPKAKSPAPKTADAEKPAKSKSTSLNNELMSEEEFAKEVERIKAVKTTPVIKSEDISQAPANISEADAPTLEEVLVAEDVEDTPSVTYRLETFYFSNGSSFLDKDYQSRIKEIVHIAKQNNAKIRILGHASSRTRNTDIATHKLTNFKVSQERAEAVAKALRKAGLPANKITTEALSDNAPAYLEVMPEGERLNRRAEVYISY